MEAPQEELHPSPSSASRGATRDGGGAQPTPAGSGKLRFSIFPNGNFTNGGGKVITIASDATWTEFKTRCLRKLFLTASQDEDEAPSAEIGENDENEENGRARGGRPLAMSTSSLRVERVWLATGAEVEAMDELENGDVLYLSIDPRQPFIPPPPSHYHSHLHSGSYAALGTSPLVSSSSPNLTRSRVPLGCRV
jgi:hypothetical protein